MLTLVAAAIHLSLAAPLTAPPARTARPESAPRAERPRPADASAYPPELREAHALLHQKCAKCHPLSVATSSPLTATQLKRHVKRPGFATSDEELARIEALLKFDASRRASR